MKVEALASLHCCPKKLVCVCDGHLHQAYLAVRGQVVVVHSPFPPGLNLFGALEVHQWKHMDYLGLRQLTYACCLVLVGACVGPVSQFETSVAAAVAKAAKN